MRYEYSLIFVYLLLFHVYRKLSGEQSRMKVYQQKLMMSMVSTNLIIIINLSHNHDVCLFVCLFVWNSIIVTVCTVVDRGGWTIERSEP